MNRLKLLLVMLVFVVVNYAHAGTIGGAVQLASSGKGVANGVFTFTLTQPAVVSGTAIVVTSPVNCYTDASGNLVGLPNPLSAALLSSSTGGGTLPAGTYFVRYTWANASGETVASPEVLRTTTATGALVVQVPANPPANATQWKIYISTSAGTETLQSAQGAPFSNYSQSTPLVSGTALPGSNTSVCSLRFNDELQPSYTGYNVNLTTTSGATVPGFPQKWYLNGGSGGMINLGSGLPLYSGMVVYPQPIISNPPNNAMQSINGPLNLNGFSVAAGQFLGGTGSASSPTFTWSSNPLNGLFFTSGGVLEVSTAGFAHIGFRTSGPTIASDMVYGITSSADPNNNPDVGLSRTAPGILAVGNGAQGDTSGTIRAAAIASSKVNGVVILDGSTYTTIQAAVTAACSTSPVSPVFLPPGTYPLNSTLSWCSAVNIIGSGSAQADLVTCPTTITTSLSSGDLFYANTQNDIHMTNLCIKNTGSAGANAAIRITAGQRNVFEHIFISGPFARGVQLDSSSTAVASNIWNEFSDIHITGLAANGVGCLLDSGNTTNKPINSTKFMNVRCQGGIGGVGFKMTNSNQVQQINETFVNCTECGANSGTAIQIDQGATRGATFYGTNAEASTTCLNKAISNTISFFGGNFSSCTTNIVDSQPAFTQFIGTNVGGIVQALGITPIGGFQIDGLGINAAPNSNSINVAAGVFQLQVASTPQAFLDVTGFRLRSVTFSTLPAAANGTIIYCSDCNSTCNAGGSTGRMCVRENGVWTH